MTEEDILAERASLYAKVEEPELKAGSRCLTVQLGKRRWLFPEGEIGLLLPRAQVTALPAGVRWRAWPCHGLINHSMTTLPLLCWGMLTSQKEPAPHGEFAILVLPGCHVALRVPGPVDMTIVTLSEAIADDHPWSKGCLDSGDCIANLDALREQGGP